MKRTIGMTLVLAVMMFLFAVVPCAAAEGAESAEENAYGVLIGADPEDMDDLPVYQTVVIDAEYFTPEEVAALQGKGSRVFSYLNIGSLETFRAAYGRFESITRDPYEDWEGEFWVDVSRPEWQDYVVGEAAKALAEKGVDGFFLDNADVYYQYETPEIFDGLCEIVRGLAQYEKDIVINGGDVFVSETLEGDEPLVPITGVNQECVFTTIDFDDDDALLPQEAEETQYYLEYLALCKARGLTVYLTEYADTDQSEARRDIEEACVALGYICHISSSIELDGK